MDLTNRQQVEKFCQLAYEAGDAENSVYLKDAYALVVGALWGRDEAKEAEIVSLVEGYYNSKISPAVQKVRTDLLAIMMDAQLKL